MSKKIRNLLVKDFCSKGVRSVNQNTNIQEVAIIMDKYKIGAILVVEEEGDKPIGIITNDDIIRKSVQYDKQPSSILAKEIMSYPLITIDPDQSITEAMRKMANNDVKRLIVVELGGKPYGVISSSDVLKHSPDYIEVLKEIIEICESSLDSEEKDTYMGYCQVCGAWSEDLKESDEGQFVCDECL